MYIYIHTHIYKPSIMIYWIPLAIIVVLYMHYLI